MSSSATSKVKSPATAFLIMAAANFLASFVFGLLWLVYKADDGSRYMLLLIAAGLSVLTGIAMIFLYGYFQRKLDALKKGTPTKEKIQ